MANVTDDLVFENARIGFRNFSGKEGRFNPPGKKNFCVFIDDRKFADKLAEDGWNVRMLQPRDDQEEPQPYMQVAVSYANKPPKIVVVTKKKQNLLNDDTVSMLDWAEIKAVDLVISPYNWSVNGRKGVKAYCKTMYVTIEEDVFEEKYSMPDMDSQVPADEPPF